MSCFIVNKNCIDDIVTLYMKYGKAYISMDKKEFGQFLWDINIIAYKNCYNEECKEYKYTYTYQESTRHELTMYSNLRCYIYNISNKDIINKDVYLDLIKLKKGLTLLFYVQYINETLPIETSLRSEQFYNYIGDKLLDYMQEKDIQTKWGN